MGLQPAINELLHGEPQTGVLVTGWVLVGQLQDRSKPLIFATARLDKVKNLTGLAGVWGEEAAGECGRSASVRLDKVKNLTGLAGCVWGGGVREGLLVSMDGSQGAMDGWRGWTKSRS